MPRLIDADELASITYHGTEGRPDKFDDGVLWILDKIDSLPTIDSVPVVRCRECKFNPKHEWTGCPMAGTWQEFNYDGFCHQGRRREEGDA